MLQDIFKEGFLSDETINDNPYLYSSTNYEVYDLGKQIRRDGINYPSIKKSRGSNYRINNIYIYTFDYKTKKWTRKYY